MTVVEQVLAPVVTERERRARVLEAAALEIEVRGWCQFKAWDDAGRVCAVGAMVKADPACLPHVIWGTDGGSGHVVDFNNAPGRTADEVTFVLRWRAEEIRDGR